MGAVPGPSPTILKRLFFEFPGHDIFCRARTDKVFNNLFDTPTTVSQLASPSRLVRHAYGSLVPYGTVDYSTEPGTPSTVILQ